jgi:competence protein ComEC
MKELLEGVVRYAHWIVVGLLFCFVIVASANIYEIAPERLRVSFLNVGQGDAIFIQSPTGTQTVIDAGSNGAIIKELGEVMPFFDRSIDLIIGTHPDGDHVGGFPDVLERYDVARVVYGEMQHDAPAADAFEQALIKWRLTKAGRVVVEPHRGDVIDLGGGAYLTILYPDRAPQEGDETNDFSIVALLRYGDTSFLFTGDAPHYVEDYLVALDGDSLNVNVLKLGHHGSRTSSSEQFLQTTKPETAIISRSCDNTYGHPHKEVTDRLLFLQIPFLDTCREGTIVFVSDGKAVMRK